MTESKPIISILKILGGCIVLLLTFQAGTLFGMHKARSSYQWGENYHRMFGGPARGFLRSMPGDDLINGHGVSGTIIAIENQSLTLKGSDGTETIAQISNDTTIRERHTTLHVSDLKSNDRIVVIGSPHGDGTIDAKIIRVFTATAPTQGFAQPFLFHSKK